ncbi:MAG: cytidine deaminase [Hyphomicrobiaceae bacterium]
MDTLVEAALRVRQRAYAPYSKHLVGAAIRDDAGKIYVGANVENAAYPQGQCAEASAIGAMVSSGGRRIVAIAVAGPGPHICTPCGGCRQRIREFAAPHTQVMVADPAGLQRSFTIDELLPEAFGPENIENIENNR